MELNENSITSKIYRWFYNKEYYEMPSNLCPYFWQLMFMWIVFIPSVILSLPYSILTKIQGKSEHHPGIGFLLWWGLYCIQCVFITLGIFFFKYKKDGYFYHSAVIGICIIIIGIVLGIKKLGEIFRNKKTYKNKQPNIIIEFVKAKYNKYCPKIDWK